MEPSAPAVDAVDAVNVSSSEPPSSLPQSSETIQLKQEKQEEPEQAQQIQQPIEEQSASVQMLIEDNSPPTSTSSSSSEPPQPEPINDSPIPMEDIAAAPSAPANDIKVEAAPVAADEESAGEIKEKKKRRPRQRHHGLIRESDDESNSESLLPAKILQSKKILDHRSRELFDETNSTVKRLLATVKAASYSRSPESASSPLPSSSASSSSQSNPNSSHPAPPAVTFQDIERIRDDIAKLRKSAQDRAKSFITLMETMNIELPKSTRSGLISLPSNYSSSISASSPVSSSSSRKRAAPSNGDSSSSSLVPSASVPPASSPSPTQSTPQIPSSSSSNSPPVSNSASALFGDESAASASANGKANSEWICGALSSRGTFCQRTGFCPFHQRHASVPRSSLMRNGKNEILSSEPSDSEMEGPQGGAADAASSTAPADGMDRSSFFDDFDDFDAEVPRHLESSLMAISTILMAARAIAKLE